MATTTNYGWTTPDDTALVKDGAAAIRTLGSSIDTSLNTALGTKKAGMVLLNTTSFSGGVAQNNIVSVFDSTYRNYRMIFNLRGATADATLTLRMLSGTTTADTGSVYGMGYQQITVAGVGSIGSTNFGTSLGLGTVETTTTNTVSFTLDLLNPNLDRATTLLLNGFFLDSGGVNVSRNGSGIVNTGTQYTGVQLNLSAGNFEVPAVVYTYGYNL